MGGVYKAYDTKLERAVAIKLLPEALARNNTAIELMKKEAKVAIGLAHPNIVKLNNFEQDKDGAYLIMEYVEGRALSDILLEKGKLSVDEALAISKQVLEALGYAHENKVVHRDLKSANIIITKDGKAKVLDFGIARVIKETMTKLTGTTATSGTLFYMAPEQLQGGMHQDGRVDIWAFGIVLYEMLSGHTPFTSDLQILQLESKPLTDIPSWLNSIIQKCLQKEPDNRFNEAQEVVKAIETKAVVSAKPAAPKPQAKAAQQTPGKNNNRVIVYAALGILILAGIAIGYGAYSYVQKAEQAKQAAIQQAKQEQAAAEAAQSAQQEAQQKAIALEQQQRQQAEQAKQVNEKKQEEQAILKTQQRAKVVRKTNQTIRHRAPPGMVYIPAGNFMMGCSPNDSNCYDNEKPYHRVYLSAYYIDKNDVTVDEYTRCVNAGGCTAPQWNNCYVWNGSSWQIGSAGSEFQEGNHPIVCVDWNQANAYCQWAGKRLPTEAQWEKAARGTDGRIYPWGNQFDCNKSCNSVSPCSHSHTCAVGSYPQGASPYGVMDMAGNVWDWVSDWYDANYYANSPLKDPQGPDSRQYRVLRGGSWGNIIPTYLRSSFRVVNDPTDRISNLFGFRCIRQVSE
ncbi:MAG: bifunctional serine/threonine-protein kinase/formylglycine-generating enzyme family protein [Deltaproteobacteria bacterium]|nr:bifunctional serine/threonine-protein kinase/formylglycine-generating enzyme family protein [Deltaproteobacteria bacterium]